MTIHRFIVAPESIDSRAEQALLSDERQVRQISRVLRLKPGDRIDILDGAGNLYTARLESVGRDEIVCSLLEHYTEKPANRPPISVVLPVLKSDRFDWAVQKLTELGVDRIQPVHTQRTVRKAGGGGNRLERWRTIAREAAEQSERYRQPEILPPQELEHILSWQAQPGLSRDRLICISRSGSPHLVQLVANHRAENASSLVSASDISIFIGPEGGFTKEEIELALSSGCTACSLGSTILRSETAAICAAVLVISIGEFL